MMAMFVWPGDAIRILTITTSATVFGFYASQAVSNRLLSWGDRGKCVGLCLLILVGMFTIRERFGKALTWRTPVVFIATLLLGYGNFRDLRDKERPWKTVK